MKTISQKTRELKEFMLQEMTVCSQCLGDAGLEVQSNALDAKREEYQHGLYKVAFTGQFDAGKSTTLNAMMHQKLLFVSINPATPVVTIINDGADNNQVTVSYRDGRPVETMSLTKFQETFRLDHKEEDRFANVREVVMQRKLPTDAVAFVDTPGLGNTANDDFIAREYLPKADAIVFMMHATQPLSATDREFIRQNFANRHLRNIFFVVNWYNNVQPGETESFHARIQDNLYDVFSDRNGNLDEDLYNDRVFFVDSFTSECARTGSSKYERRGIKYIETPVPAEEDQYTGIPEFESSLYRFLESSDLPRNAFSGYLPTMAGMYRDLHALIAERRRQMALSISDLEKEVQTKQREIDELEGIVSRIERYYTDAIESIMGAFGTTYSAFVTSVENNWEDYFKARPIKFGLKEETKLLGLRAKYTVSDAWHGLTNFFSGQKTSESEKELQKAARDRELQAVMRPVQDAIKEFLEQEKEKMRKKFIANCAGPIQRLAKNIELECREMEELDLDGLGIEQILLNLLAEQGVDVNNKPENVSIAQLLICAMLGNLDLMLAGAANGRKDWISFLLDNVAAEAFEWGIAFAIVMLVGPVGWLYYAVRIVFGFFNIRNHGKSLGQDMALQSKSVMVQELKNNQNKVIMEMESHVSDTLDSNAKRATNGFHKQLKQQKRELSKLLERRKQHEIDSQAELNRLQNDAERVLGSIQRLGQELQSTAYSEESILSYAVTSVH